MPTTTTTLIRYFSTVYGKSCCEGVRHGGHGWFVDQSMISKRIEEWKREKVVTGSVIYNIVRFIVIL